MREECTVWVGGIPDAHPRLEEGEPALRRFFAQRFGEVLKIALRLKPGSAHGSWCLVTFQTLDAAHALLKNAADLDDGLEGREGCPLEIRHCNLKDQLRTWSTAEPDAPPQPEQPEPEQPEPAAAATPEEALGACAALYDEGAFVQAIATLSAAIERCLADAAPPPPSPAQAEAAGGGLERTQSTEQRQRVSPTRPLPRFLPPSANRRQPPSAASGGGAGGRAARPRHAAACRRPRRDRHLRAVRAAHLWRQQPLGPLG